MLVGSSFFVLLLCLRCLSCWVAIVMFAFDLIALMGFDLCYLRFVRVYLC